MNKEYLTWEELTYYCTKYVNKQMTENAFTYTYTSKPIIIGIGTGGLIPAAIIGKGLDCPVYNLGISSRSDDMTTKNKIDIYQIPETHILRECSHILLIDDLIDTGKTFEIATDILKEKAQMELYIKYFSVLVGEEPKQDNISYGRIYDNTTTWIDFPWEIG